MTHAVDLAQFYLDEALRLLDAAIVSAETAKAERLRVWLLERWPHAEILPGEVVQSGPNSLRELKAAKAAIKTLVDAGWLIPLDEGTKVPGKTRKAACKIVKSAL